MLFSLTIILIIIFFNNFQLEIGDLSLFMISINSGIFIVLS